MVDFYIINMTIVRVSVTIPDDLFSDIYNNKDVQEDGLRIAIGLQG